MRGNRHIDKYIREKLEDYPSEVPMDIWDKIDAERSARKKDIVVPVFAWKKYLGLAIAVCAVVVMSLWLFKNDEIKKDNSIVESSMDLDKKDNVNNNKADQLAISTFDTQTNSISSTYTTNQEIKNLDISEKVSSKYKDETNAIINNIKSDKRLINQELNHSNIAVTKNLVSNNQNDLTTIAKETSSVNELNTTNISATEVENENVIADKQINANRKLFGNALQQLSSSYEYLSDEPIAMEEEFDLPDVKCAAFQKRRSGIIFEADLFISPERAYRSLEASNEEFEEYTEKRNETESTYYSFSTGARLSVLMPNGIAARAGIVYAQINEIFDYVDPNATATSITYVLVDTIVVNMDTTFVIDTLSSTTTGTRFKTTVNRYNMVDIPIMLGFELELSKVVFNINGGVNFNVLFRKKGDILSPEMVPVSFSSNNSNAYPAFKDKLGVSLIGSVGINYKINNRLQLLFEPNFKYQFRPITLDNYIVKQKYFTTGFMTGLRIRF